LLEQHHKGNEQFKIALSSLITLASHAYDLFESSTIDEKRQLLGYVFSNLELEGATLRFSLRKPFNLFADLATCQEWLPLVSILRTEKREAVANFSGYLLQTNSVNAMLSQNVVGSSNP
jgi:hypothetical protein